MADGRTVYHSKVFDVHEATVTAPDGKQSTRAWLIHPGSVGIVPIIGEGADARVLLITQTRQAIGNRLWELPAGTREPGEDPQATAKREIQEEINYTAGHMEKLTEFYLAPGYSNELMHLYLATDLRPAEGKRDEDEDIEVVAMPFAEAVARARAGEWNDVKTIAGLLLVAARFGV
ncbi:MAG: NUDIX hydrolase [Anaerolineae bacterium]